MARVLLDNVVKRYGSVLALDRLALEVHDGRV
jgi:ABC-type sugar transport system ATPase subunit